MGMLEEMRKEVARKEGENKMVQEKLQKQLKETNQKFRDQMTDLQKKMQERHEGDLNKLKTEKQKLLASHKEQIELNDNNWDEKIKKIKKKKKPPKKKKKKKKK